MVKVNGLYRYPVKGLSADLLDQTEVQKDQGFLFDRYWALENGARNFNPKSPRHIPKGRFLQLAKNPKLARLRCQFDEDSHTLIIVHEGTELGRGDMRSASGIEIIERCIGEFLSDELSERPRLVSARDHHFCDIPEKALSIINLASVAEISKAAGQEISGLRFRGNIYIDGLEPWVEMDWQGKTINIDGQSLFEVFAVTGRCPATKVNLKTGERDVEMLDVLSSSFGHTACGVYVKVIDDGTIRTGSQVTISPNLNFKQFL